MAAMSFTQARQPNVSAPNMSLAAEANHPRQSKGKKKAAAPPINSPPPDKKEMVAAYVSMVKDKKRMNRLKEWSDIYHVGSDTYGTVHQPNSSHWC
jgi:hypothetical protein